MRVLSILLAVMLLMSSGCGLKNSDVVSNSEGSSSNDTNVDPVEPTDWPEPGGDSGYIPTGRTITCGVCHETGVCYHCNGEKFRNGRRCSICDGTGLCQSCDGVGFHDVVEKDGKDYYVCARCDGTGDCRRCGGTGKRQNRIEPRCALCKGSGDCSVCHGKGVIEVGGF